MKPRRFKSPHRPFDERLLNFIAAGSAHCERDRFVGTILRIAAIIAVSSGFKKSSIVKAFSQYLDLFERDKDA